MGLMRSLLEHERPLVEFLCELVAIRLDLDTLRVQPMNDGEKLINARCLCPIHVS